MLYLGAGDWTGCAWTWTGCAWTWTGCAWTWTGCAWTCAWTWAGCAGCAWTWVGCAWIWAGCDKICGVDDTAGADTLEELLNGIFISGGNSVSICILISFSIFPAFNV